MANKGNFAVYDKLAKTLCGNSEVETIEHAEKLAEFVCFIDKLVGKPTEGYSIVAITKWDENGNAIAGTEVKDYPQESAGTVEYNNTTGNTSE